MQTDKGVRPATSRKGSLASHQCDRANCALAITRANRKILTLAETLSDGHRVLLEGLLRQPTESTVAFVFSVCDWVIVGFE